MKHKKTIWVHTLVCNEENYLWYAVMSVVDFVDKILLWDSGSTDNTVKIIQQIKKAKGEKIDFKEVGKVNPEDFTKVRQAMLDQTNSDWLIVVDGDEIWWDKSIKLLVDTIQTENLESIISPHYNLVGDIYHYQREDASRYRIDERTGFINIRAINRKIPGLHVENPYGSEGFFDKDGTPIQQRPKKFRQFLNTPYLHLTHLKRSSQDNQVMMRSSKLKYEIGKPPPKNFNYPEVFSRPRPAIVPSPWRKIPTSYFARASVETFLKKIIRKIKLGGKSGC